VRGVTRRGDFVSKTEQNQIYYFYLFPPSIAHPFMAERGKNAGEPVEADDKVEEILLVHDREDGEVGPGDPAGGGQRSVEQVQFGGHRKAVEEQQEREAEQVLL